MPGRALSLFFKYERLPEVNDIPQTRVTYCIQVDLRGLIPMFITNSKIISQLETLSSMREKFDKSLEKDAGQRTEIVKKIKREEEARGRKLWCSLRRCSRRRMAGRGHLGASGWPTVRFK